MSSFSMLLKDELVSLDQSDSELKAMLMGLLQVNASINFSSSGLYLDFKSKNEKVAMEVYNLIKKFYQLEPTFLMTKEVRLNKEDIYYTRLEQSAHYVLNDLNIIKAKESKEYNLKKELQTEEERLAYLRGAFLACGSVNDPSSNTYHLEIQTFSANVAYILRDLMNSYSLNAKISKNRRGYIVYLKSSEKIGDFIRILGSTEGLFKFEDERIEKDISNSINRVMNCEIANEKKTQLASKRQLKEIEVVSSYYGTRLKPTLIEALTLRLNHPEENLNELASFSQEELGKSISKSALNHRFREIHNLYEEILEKRSKNNG